MTRKKPKIPLAKIVKIGQDTVLVECPIVKGEKPHTHLHGKVSGPREAHGSCTGRYVIDLDRPEGA